MTPSVFLATLFPLLAVVADVAQAFSFNFATPPTECANVTVQWTGGSAPFKLLLVPTGALHPEVRIIADHTIDSGNSFSFPLKYPGNSTFVAVMSDATGFGSGGTTNVTTVVSAHGANCFPKSQVAPEFLIFTDPPVPQECSPMTISYNTDARPPVDIFLVIPGGPSSRIESGSPSNRSFEWTPAMRQGTQVMIVAGDTSGAGKGGSTDILTVASGNSTGCLNAQQQNTTSSPTDTVSASSAATASAPARNPSGAIPCLSLSLWTVVSGFLLVLFQ